LKNHLKGNIFSLFAALSILFSLVGMPAMGVKAAATITFTGEELLGKPENTSITINIVPDTTIEYHYQYGLTAGANTWSTIDLTAIGGQPSELTITGLTPNTQYFYRMQYHAPGDDPDDWVNRSEHSFWTQRAAGSTFTFTIVSDSHAMYNAQYQQAVADVISDHPDFHFDLGDTFMTDSDTNQSQVNQEYLVQRNLLYIGGIGQSSPIFLASGNHENEEGWNLDDTPFSIALGSVLARKLYYPTPIDDGFYSGNTDILAAINPTTYGDQYREDYYAWEWGDALFVVFDPFQYTMTNPYGATAGEGNDDPASGDRWNWTLGLQQYTWLKQTLENSNAKYKFMFAHHMLGGTQNYVRGGAVPAHMFEWGGYNADGTTWGFDTKRPTFGYGPIRQLMIDYGVSAFFHGHDHQYAYELRDGIVYLSMPRPSTGLDFNYYNESDPYTERVLPSPGYLRVTVAPDQTTVEYITSSNSSKAVQHSFTIAPNTSAPKNNLTTAVNPSNGGTVSPAPGTHPYDEGEVVSISAVPNTGYHFVNWTGDVSTVANVNAASTTITMDDDYSITANFAIDTHTLTVAAGTGGTITAPPISPSTHNYGEVVTITALPTTGYHFVNWTGDVSTVANVNAASTNITMHGDYTILANFAEDIYYNLTVGNDGHGSVSLNPAGGNYLSGTTVTLIPQPNESYQFSSWSGPDAGDILNTSGVYTIVMNENKSVSANFTQIMYTLTVTNDGHGSVTLDPPGGTYSPGTIVSLTPVPNTNYQFLSWSGTNAGDISYSAGVYSIAMDGNKSIRANFISIITYTLSASSSGHGSVTLNPPGGNYISGTTVTLIPMPDEGYQFSSWSGPNAGDIINTGGIYTIVMNDNKSVTANFTQIMYTLTVTNDGHGSVTLDPAGGIYSSGTIVTLTPVPNTNYQFLSWTGTNAGDISYSAGVYSIAMDGNKSIRANFILITTYTLTASSSGHGSVTLNPPGGTYASGTTVTLTPVPNADYHFVSWSGPDAGDIINTAGVYTIVMNANKSVTANFAIDTYTLTVSNDGHGSVTLNPAGGTYAAGTIVTLTPAPSPGYHFVSWSGPDAGDIINTAGVYTIVMDANKSVTANFAIDIHFTYLPIIRH
jgi:prophage antirepressor-like protein